jgi:hypothetical protein
MGNGALLALCALQRPVHRCSPDLGFGTVARSIVSRFGFRLEPLVLLISKADHTWVGVSLPKMTRVAVERGPLHKVGPKWNVLDFSWPRPALECELSFEIVLQIGTVVDCISAGEDGEYRVACLMRLLGQVSVTNHQGDQSRRARNHFPQNLLASARSRRQPPPFRPPQPPILYSLKKPIEGLVECSPYRTVVRPKLLGRKAGTASNAGRTGGHCARSREPANLCSSREAVAQQAWEGCSIGL